MREPKNLRQKKNYKFYIKWFKIWIRDSSEKSNVIIKLVKKQVVLFNNVKGGRCMREKRIGPRTQP